MEGLFSATLGELVSRCISFLIDKCSTSPSLSKGEVLQRLDRMLLRVLIIVEEAEGRSITNRAMLRELNMLRQEMCRGYYLLDKFRYLGHEEGKAKDLETSRRTFTLSISFPVLRAPLSASSTHDEKELRKMLETVENVVTDMHEFVAFLNNYPPICCRQPYNMHLVLETCMFGRQAEVERIINFLLQREPPGEHGLGLGVLPIVGPGKVGKSTLVECVCCDIRVRDHFSQIVLVCGNKFVQGELCTLREGGKIKHRNQSGTPSEEKTLVVIELNGDVDEGAWTKLCSASPSFIPRGSKIIITSGAENITRFGNTQALRLNFLPREESWYFFKVLAFGSADPEEHPKLASIAMEIFEGYYDLEMFNDYTGPFANSKVIAGYLRADVSIHHWRKILTCVKGNKQRNAFQFTTACSGTTRVENQPYLYLQRISNLSQDCVVDCRARVELAQENIPKITMDEVLYGSSTPQGRFDAVVWKSHLPPHYTYVTSCEIRESKLANRRKFCQKRKSLC